MIGVHEDVIVRSCVLNNEHIYTHKLTHTKMFSFYSSVVLDRTLNLSVSSFRPRSLIEQTKILSGLYRRVARAK